ncbi:MAG TPA: VOC family protein [Thermoleophilaceae bacterium]|nr:VOC family protein [Thermoleophilaceae bacterium]
MRLEGIHHITAITGDAPGNVDFYARVLGLRLVKKTVNQDQPSVYHLFYADEQGSPGADITFFEFPGAAPGRAGAGMVHTIVWRVASEEALDFWSGRLAAEGVETERGSRSLSFADPEGLRHELLVANVPDQPLIADHPEVPRELALQGFHAARAYASHPDASTPLIEEQLGFTPVTDGDDQPANIGAARVYEVRGESRGGHWIYDEPPAEPGREGAGTVHHIAFASTMDDHEAWRERALAGGARATEVIDRFWFKSIYFREPSGVLFEIATLGPGFDADEDPARLGEKLVLPPRFEPLREKIEATLTPIENPRTP